MPDYLDETALGQHIDNVVRLNTPAREPIKATPWVWREPHDIPRREWLYGRHYIRKFVSGTVGPGGFGKSTHNLVEAVAMASGKPLLNVRIPGPLRVWYWNGEDPQEELDRRIAAICLHYGVGRDDLGDRLHIDNGRDCKVIIATEGRDGMTVAKPVVSELIGTILDRAIDVFMLDPFVSIHEVSENSNSSIGKIIETFAEIADATNSAGELVHHTRKALGNGVSVTVEDGRGAGAFVDRVRSARALNRMTVEEAQEFGVADEDRRSYFRIDQGKANLSPPARKAIWRRLVDVGIGNADTAGPEDRVGVVTVWSPTGLFEDIKAEDTLRVQQAIFKGMFRAQATSTDWVGLEVAKTLGLDMSAAAVRHRVQAMLKTWMENGLLVTADREDKFRKIKQFVEVGRWMEC